MPGKPMLSLPFRITIVGTDWEVIPSGRSTWLLLAGIRNPTGFLGDHWGRPQIYERLSRSTAIEGEDVSALVQKTLDCLTM